MAMFQTFLSDHFIHSKRAYYIYYKFHYSLDYLVCDQVLHCFLIRFSENSLYRKKYHPSNSVFVIQIKWVKKEYKIVDWKGGLCDKHSRSRRLKPRQFKTKVLEEIDNLHTHSMTLRHIGVCCLIRERTNK